MIMFSVDSAEHAAYSDIKSVRLEDRAVSDEALRELIERIVPVVREHLEGEFEEQLGEANHARANAEEEARKSDAKCKTAESTLKDLREKIGKEVQGLEWTRARWTELAV